MGDIMDGEGIYIFKDKEEFLKFLLKLEKEYDEKNKEQ